MISTQYQLPSEVVNSNEYDIVLAYFIGTKMSVDIAKNFTGFLFTVANLTKQPIMSLLDSFKNAPSQEAMSMLAYYLNSAKSPTALYGVSKIPVPNQLVQRNVVV